MFDFNIHSPVIRLKEMSVENIIAEEDGEKQSSMVCFYFGAPEANRKQRTY